MFFSTSLKNTETQLHSIRMRLIEHLGVLGMDLRAQVQGPEYTLLHSKSKTSSPELKRPLYLFKEWDCIHAFLMTPPSSESEREELRMSLSQLQATALCRAWGLTSSACFTYGCTGRNVLWISAGYTTTRSARKLSHRTQGEWNAREEANKQQ